MYSWLIWINSSIICVRYSLLMKGLEMPMVKGAPSAPGASVAGASVGASVAGISVAGGAVAGGWVGGGASVVGAPQAASREAIVINTVNSKTNFLLWVDIFIFSYLLIRFPILQLKVICL